MIPLILLHIALAQVGQPCGVTDDACWHHCAIFGSCPNDPRGNGEGRPGIFIPNPPEHVIEIRTKRTRPEDCANPKYRASAEVIIKCLNEINGKCHGDELSTGEMERCYQTQPSCQKQDEINAAYAEHCQETTTKTLWIDGQRIGVIKEVEEK